MFETFREISSTGDLIVDSSKNLTVSPCLNNELNEKYEMNQSEAFTVDEETKTDISEVSLNFSTANINSEGENNKHPLVLQPGKKWARSLSVYKRMSKISDPVDETLSGCEDFKNKLKRNRRSTNNIRKFMEFQGSQNDTTNSRRTTFLSTAVRPSVTILQVAYGLAVAEEAFQFEHRDLHWGNVLIAPTEEKFATFVVRGRVVRVPRHGLAATVIDYTLSRMVLRPPAGSPVALFHDLAGDNSLFEADGDYQFDVFREMQLFLKNDWKNYEPYTNILWLHYTSVKIITEVHYTKPNTAVHKHYINKLKSLKNQLRSTPAPLN